MILSEYFLAENAIVLDNTTLRNWYVFIIVINFVGLAFVVNSENNVPVEVHRPIKLGNLEFPL